MEWKRMIVTKIKKIFNVAINRKINLQSNLAIMHVQNHNHLLYWLIKEQAFQTNKTSSLMIRDTKYSELNSFR